MCGIAGIYSYHSAAVPADREELRSIRDYMRSRGPDGKGEWYSADSRLALGHRRLAIIDPSERGAQPMVSGDSRYAITFNGEIYNHHVLRDELQRLGRRFHSDSDTEVLLQLYAEYGPSMVTRLRGMFAFAIWDAQDRTLFLARDPYGIKPLYYADDGRVLRFASQVKALCAGGAVPANCDPAGLLGFYLFGSVPEPFTIYEGVKALPAGSTLMVSGSGVGKPNVYFSIANVLAEDAAEPPAVKESEISEWVREAVLDSVRHHLVSDVPVGAFLSAGVDSGAIVGLMKDAGQDEVRTVTLAFEEYRGTANDEAPLAAQTAARYNTKHHLRTVARAEFLADLPTILRDMDQPSIDGLNTWLISKATAEQGLKVALSGLGGDELVGGYPSFRDIPRWVSRCSSASRVPLLGRLFRQFVVSLPGLDRIVSPKVAGLLEYGGDYPGAYLLRRGLFMPWEVEKLMGRELFQVGWERLQPLNALRDALAPMPDSPFARVAVMEGVAYMRNQLLRDADWAGMAHSLEIRIPLVDSELLRRFAFLIRRGDMAGKVLLGGTPRNPLPDEIVHRPKTGFSVPMREWAAEISVASAHKPMKGEATGWARSWARFLGDHWQRGLPIDRR